MQLVSNPQKVAAAHKNVSKKRQEQLIDHLKATPDERLPKVAEHFRKTAKGVKPAERDLVLALLGQDNPATG